MWLRSALVLAAMTLIGQTAAGQAAVPEAVRAEDAPPTAVSFGPQTVARYRFGAKVVAAGAAVANAKIVMAVPLVCPEQEVELISDDASPHASIAYRLTDEGVRHMLITIRGLPAHEEAHAFATFEVRTRTVLPPRETAGLSIPKRPSKAVRRYLTASPLIDVNDRRIKAAVEAALPAAEASAPPSSDWQRVEALYDYALKHVAYQLGDDKSSVQALADAQGDCQAISAVFVAMCRTLKVPARMVWVDGHQYAEFYLESGPGRGAWHPVESAGTRVFGGMPLARVILQKGDNIRVPEQRGAALRYASDFAVFPAQPSEPPAISFVREKVE